MSHKLVKKKNLQSIFLREMHRERAREKEGKERQRQREIPDRRGGFQRIWAGWSARWRRWPEPRSRAACRQWISSTPESQPQNQGCGSGSGRTRVFCSILVSPRQLFTPPPKMLERHQKTFLVFTSYFTKTNKIKRTEGYYITPLNPYPSLLNEKYLGEITL